MKVPRARPQELLRQPRETCYAEITSHFEEGGTAAELVERWSALSGTVASHTIDEDAKREMIEDLTELYERMNIHCESGGAWGEFVDQESHREKEVMMKQCDEARRHFEESGSAEELVEMWLSRHDHNVPHMRERLRKDAEQWQHHFEQGGSAEELVDKEFGNLFL